MSIVTGSHFLFSYVATSTVFKTHKNLIGIIKTHDLSRSLYGFRSQELETLYIGWINNKVLLYSTGNYSQGRIFLKKNVYICITSSFHLYNGN